jgi:inosose dehydratase
MHTASDRRTFLALGGAGILAAAAGRSPAAPAKPAPKKPKPAEKWAPPPVKKYPFKLGLASYSLRKFDLDKTLEMTKRVSLDYICLKSMHLPLESTPEQIDQAVAKVKAAGLLLYACGVVGMKNSQEVDQAFNYAKRAGMSTIVAAPAPEVLSLLDKKVKQFGIQIAIHNHGPGDKVWPTPQSIYDKVKDLDRRIGLCMDIGHTLRIGADPIASAERYADRLCDVHIKDVTAPTPKGATLQCGRGAIDLVRFLRTLKKINYQGILSFEYEADGDDPLPGLAESVGYIRGVMASL